MSAPPSLVELRGRIRTLGREALLDVPVAEIRASLPDAEVGRVLAYIAEHLKLRTLGDLLGNRDAQNVLDGALTATNRAFVLETLADFVGQGGGTPRRAPPRPFRSGVPEPDRTPAKVEEWAIAHGIAKLLDEPAAAVRPFLEKPSDFARSRLDPTATVFDFVQRKRLPDGLKSHSHLASTYADAARAFLRDAAERKARAKHLLSLVEKRPAAEG